MGHGKRAVDYGFGGSVGFWLVAAGRESMFVDWARSSAAPSINVTLCWLNPNGKKNIAR